MEKYKEIEKSIIKTYRKEIWSKFVKAVNEYKLISDNDKIMVCISGGKDSFLMAKCFQELKRHGKNNFDLEFIVMNPGYEENTLKQIKDNAKLLNLDIKIFDTNIFEVANKLSPDSPCYMCARMRRGYLYDKASELGCNKIALGHHFDDVIETTLLSMFYGAEVKTMVPKVRSSNFDGLELIRPLYLIKEKDIKNFCTYNDLKFINCACSFTKTLEHDKGKRLEVKNLINELRNKDANIDYNIFKAMGNINLDCTIGYKKSGNVYDFNDIYEGENII